MKIEFENSIRRLSFLCHLTDIKIAWINPQSRQDYIKAQLSPLIFIIVLEALFRELRSRCLRELIYADDLALETETLESLKRRVKACKGALRVNVKKTKLMISSENAAKFTEEGKFLCAEEGFRQ